MNIIKALTDYRRRFPGEGDVIDRFERFLIDHDQVMDRNALPGHITACVWIRSYDQTKVLLMNHTKLGKWIQLRTYRAGRNAIGGSLAGSQGREWTD